MFYRLVALAAFSLGLALSAAAQASKESRIEILHSVIALQVVAQVAMPFGSEGLEMSVSGEIEEQKLDQEIRQNGRSIEPGKVVTISAIDFGDKSIEVELDGGGKNKKSFLSKVQIGVGVAGKEKDTSLDRDDTSKAKGSKVTLKFAGKVPPDLTSEQLKQLLGPVLDFTQRDLKTGLESLPPEIKEAILAKKALIGMDRDLLLRAMGRPDNRSREMVGGVEQETWIYRGRGYRSTFVVLEHNTVVSIKEFSPNQP